MNHPHLPVELLCQVLYFLDVDDLLRCGAFALELAKHRMLSLMSPAEFPSYSARLKLIRERERNWRSPHKWGQLQKLELPPTGTVYEFVGGYYANGREDENKITSGISFFELPSTEPMSTDAPLKTWTHAMGGIKIVDFTMDPAQDLLVLVALAPPQCESVYQLHLRSFATNEPHPESSLPMGVLSCLPKVTDHHIPLETTGAVRVQVAGDLVALLVKEVHDSVSAHLQIWNWRHGSHHSCAMARMAGIEDFTFLSDDTFLIVRPSGRFECYTFENPIGCSTVPTLKSSYNLPPLQDGFMYWYICMSSNPAPGYIPPGTGTGSRVYYPRPDERIHACCLYIFKPTGPGDHHVHSFVFFLNVKMFLDAPAPAPTGRQDIYPVSGPTADPDEPPVHPFQLFAPHPSFFAPANLQQQPFAYPPPPPPPTAPVRSRQQHLRSLLVGSGVQTVPWDAWGPRHTRWFDEALSTDWQHALYGLKTVECVDPAAPSRPEAVSPGDILDAGDDEADARAPAVNPANLPTVNDLLNGIGFDVVDEGDHEAGEVSRQRLGPAQRHLRIRDYNPYALLVDPESDEDVSGAATGKGKGKQKASDRRIVTTSSTTPSRGVFVKDIVSELPYSEVVSEEKYNVTDVMMDDCRVLLMQRGKGGKLKGIDILTM
ncbi:hypothetical protein B0H15DRAFT_766450 [Mycena belliarum]|uniref:F-box domain-containing protein n=1 Tax=Mycena belliarum TaxID=1033014 RepID=A0AAD6UJ85_9AGAR|nr:hypothetical protein B0H15DRAFT_766450 [Mycena belliae]